MRPSTTIAFDYEAFVSDLKTRIASALFTATRAITSELVGLYWDIGAAIREKQTRPFTAEAMVSSSDWHVTSSERSPVRLEIPDGAARCTLSRVAGWSPLAAYISELITRSNAILRTAHWM